MGLAANASTPTIVSNFTTILLTLCHPKKDNWVYHADVRQRATVSVHGLSEGRWVGGARDESCRRVGRQDDGAAPGEV